MIPKNRLPDFIYDNVLVLHEIKRINQPLTFGKCVNDVILYKSFVILFQLQKLIFVDFKLLRR